MSVSHETIRVLRLKSLIDNKSRRHRLRNRMVLHNVDRVFGGKSKIHYKILYKMLHQAWDFIFMFK